MSEGARVDIRKGHISSDHVHVMVAIPPHVTISRLLQHSPRLATFRLVFGDERTDYSEALTWHYQRGAPTDWPQRFISAYASAHPWEDWAETWAHYLHMTDALETAVACGLSLQPLRPDEPSLQPTARG